MDVTRDEVMKTDPSSLKENTCGDMITLPYYAES